MMKFLFSRIKKDMILNALIVLVLGASYCFIPTAATALVVLCAGRFAARLWRHHHASVSQRSLSQRCPPGGIAHADRLGCLRPLSVPDRRVYHPLSDGDLFLFCGIRETACALSLKDAGYSGWQVNLTLALIMSAAGILLIFNPFTAAAFAVRFIGIMLIYDAVSQLWNIHCLSSHARGFFK